MYEIIRTSFAEIVDKNGIRNSKVFVNSKVLSKDEAIGKPEHDDYPLLKGRESLVESNYCNSKGAAYSDMCGSYEGLINDIVNMELTNNFKRAIFISTINAVLKHLGLIEKTEHCRNEGPVNCAKKLKDFILSLNSNPKILLIGYQPRFAETLTENFKTRIIDLDTKNIGRTINNVSIESEDRTESAIKWADILFVTSSSFINGTAEKFIVSDKKVIFYGVSGAGPTHLLDLNRYCEQ